MFKENERKQAFQLFYLRQINLEGSKHFVFNVCLSEIGSKQKMGESKSQMKNIQLNQISQFSQPRASKISKITSNLFLKHRVFRFSPKTLITSRASTVLSKIMVQNYHKYPFSYANSIFIQFLLFLLPKFFLIHLYLQVYNQLTIQMSKIIVATFLLLQILSIVCICPDNCNSCANTTACTTCSSGYFLVAGSSCAPCPNNCLTCSADADGKPTCLTCAGSSQLAAGKCFLCKPSCATCSSPDSCLTCISGLTLTSGVCSPNPSCTIPNCNACGTSNGVTVCTTCSSGYFPFNGGCFACSLPATDCTFNQATFWTTQVAGTFRTFVGTALSINPSSPPGGLSSYFNNFDFAGMPANLKKGWIIAFLVYKNLQIFVPAAAVSTVAGAGKTFYDSISSLSWDQQLTQIVGLINQQLFKSWTVNDLMEKCGRSLAAYTTITSCAGGYVLDSGSCPSCSLNCLTCTSPTVCTVCAKGYFVDSNACRKCNNACLECSGAATTCTKCIAPLSLSSGTCVVCNEPCKTCTTGSFCLLCNPPYSSSANATSGQCFRCSQDSCSTCIQSNPEVCLKCKNGFLLSSGVCSSCPSNCQNCISGLCSTCNPGFSNVNGTCVACGAGCSACAQSNPEVCLTCNSGFYLNKASGVCGNCQDKCLACTGPKTCSQPESGIVFYSGQPVRCNQGCQKCDSTTPTICLSCLPGFFVSSTDNNYCQKCGTNCKQCTSQTTCTSCLPNFNLDNGLCLSCNGNCRECNPANLTICTSCKKGYTLIGDQCIFNCSSGCLQCLDDQAKTCQICSQGFTLKDGACVRCLSGCTGTCDPSNIASCLTCANGFEKKNNKCVPCSKGCVKCLNGACLQCQSKLRLTQSSAGVVCTPKCNFPCAECTGTVCTKCQAGYTQFMSSTCILDVSCNDACPFCPQGSYKNATDSKCYKCPIDGCASCTANGATCISCLSGYYKKSGTSCLACPIQCSTCSSQSLCNQCAAGYVKEIVAMQSSLSDAVFGQKCLACTQNCKTCFVYPNQCTSCKTGFQLQNSKCISPFAVSFSYEVNIAFSQFLLRLKSEQFISLLANTLGVTSNQVNIEDLRSGSTVIIGSVVASNYQSASAIQGSLSSSSVPGFPVLSYTSQVNYNNQAYSAPSAPQQKVQTQKQNNTLLISIVVGAGVALIFIVFIVYMVCRKKQQNVNLNETTNLRMAEKDQSSQIQIGDPITINRSPGPKKSVKK